MNKLISIKEAAALGIDRVRSPKWVIKTDHLKLNIVDGKAGLWLHLFSTLNKALNRRDPVAILALLVDYAEPEFCPYDGPLPDSNEYQAEAEHFNNTMRNVMNEETKPLPDIKMCACDSSQLSEYGYDESTKTLAIKFKHGGNVYHYDNVSPELFSEFNAAESKGSFFGKRIKNGGFSYKKIVPVKIDDGDAPEAA